MDLFTNHATNQTKSEVVQQPVVISNETPTQIKQSYDYRPPAPVVLQRKSTIPSDAPRCPTTNSLHDCPTISPHRPPVPLFNSEYNIQPCTAPHRPTVPLSNSKYNIHDVCTVPHRPTVPAVRQQIQYATITVPNRPTVPLSNSKYNIHKLLYHTVRRCCCPTANTIYNNYFITSSDGAVVRQRILTN